MDRPLLLAIAVMLAAATPVAAEDPVVAEDPVAVITAQEREWAAAAVSKEVEVLDRLLHDRFRLVTLYHLNPAVVERAEYLMLQAAGRAWAFRSMTPVAINVELRGELAIAMVDMEVGWPSGVAMPTDFRFTDVWVLRDEGWRVISRYSELR